MTLLGSGHPVGNFTPDTEIKLVPCKIPQTPGVTSKKRAFLIPETTVLEQPLKKIQKNHSISWEK